MNRLWSVLALVGVALSLATPALADGRHHDRWRHDDWRGNGWRGNDWRWDRPHKHRPFISREVIVVYPSRSYYAGPRVVYAQPPLQAVPTSSIYTDRFGRYCREYQSTMIIGGMAQSGFGTACMQPDGSWEVVR